MLSMSKFYYMTFFFMVIWCLLMNVFCYFLIENNILLLEFELYTINSVTLNYLLYVDKISLLFSLIVFLISSVILVYSKIYLGEDCYRFLWVTFFFVFYMMLMIYSPSCLGVIVGWDGLGLISYCLVIYYQSKDAFNSGFITAASNRFGDSMLIMAIIWFAMSSSFSHWENGSGVEFLMVACLTKSAQFPFCAWLPLAMAAPTPISSLVHSSTLVTAGVYMMIRFNFLLFWSGVSFILTVLSLLTIFIAGVGALSEYDLKRVIALSTLGQLGFMMMILSVGYFYIAFFHLLVHALFKALLFMCAGAVIHSGGSIQDLRKMGSVSFDLSIKISFLISCLCLMGLPFSSGFFSKDLLLEIIWMGWSGLSMGGLMYVGAFMTIAYSMQLLEFLSSNNFWVVWLESSSIFSCSILFLSVMNIVGGGLLNWILMDNLNLVCLSFIFKVGPLLLLMMGFIWKGAHSDLWLLYFGSSLFYTMTCSKNLSFLIRMMFWQMNVLDQGWLEWSMTQVKLGFIQVSFFLKLFSLSYLFINLLSLLFLMILFV
uniref:NADH-ubiquinone oxidoreductase chain 5 n=1 Tax=Rhinocola aceris TaxID=1889912 RepID=A0A343KN34_9HEMI|nr:NADH dehydrogenase subunit 5 [Rhinocola aceris]